MSGVRRRSVLQGLAASAGVSAAGCSRDAATRPGPALRFVGQSPQRGHAIRDATLREGAAAERVQVDTLIVGGGVAGTAAAWRLTRAGIDDFLLVELEDHFGGTATSGHSKRSEYPMGAHYLPSPHPEFGALRALLRELGVETGTDAAGRAEYDPTLVCRAPVERHRYKGQWFAGIYPALGQSPDEAAQWTRWQEHLTELDAARGTDGRRLFALPIEHSSTQLRHLAGVSMASYLDERGFDSWRLRWTVDYACRDDYGLTLSQTSAFAGLHHFLSRGLEEVHDRVTLMWAGGNGELVRRMAEAAQLQPRRRSGLAVVSLDPRTGRARAWDFTREHAVEIQARTVLWAAPRFILPHVLPPGDDPLPQGALTYAPWLVANVGVERRPAGIGTPLAWDNVQVDTPHLGYVVATHNESLPDAKTRSGTVLTFYDARLETADMSLSAQRTRLLTAELPDLAAEVTTALEGMHPGITPTIREIEIARWGHAMVRPVPGLLFSDALATAAAPIGAVFPCATDVGGVPLFEQAFCNGVRAAEQALFRAGHPVDTIVPPHAG